MIEVYKDGVRLGGFDTFALAYEYTQKHVVEIKGANAAIEVSERNIGGHDAMKVRSFVKYDCVGSSPRYDLRLRGKYLESVEERYPVGMRIESVNKNHPLSEPTYVLAHHLPYIEDLPEMLLGDIRGNVRSVWGHDIVDDVVTPTDQVVTLIDGGE